MVVLIIDELQDALFLVAFGQRAGEERVQLSLILIDQIVQWSPIMKLSLRPYITMEPGFAMTTPPVAEKETQAHTPWSSSAG